MAGINLLNKLKKKAQPAYEELQVEGETSVDGTVFDFLTNFESRQDSRKLLFQIGGSIAFIFIAQFLVGFITEQLTIAIEQRRDAISVQLDEQKSKLSELQVFTNQAKAYDVKVKEIQKKLSIVDRVAVKRNVLMRMLDYVVRELPSEVWIQSIEVNPNGDVKVEGFAVKLQDVSHFMTRLEGGIFFPNWNLEETVGVDPESVLNRNRVGLPAETKRFKIAAKVIK